MRGACFNLEDQVGGLVDHHDAHRVVAADTSRALPPEPAEPERYPLTKQGSTGHPRRPRFAATALSATSPRRPSERLRPSGYPSVTSAPMSSPDLTAAADVVELARDVVRRGPRPWPPAAGPDDDQVLAYDLAHAGAGGGDGPLDARVRRPRRGRGAPSPAPSWPTPSASSPPACSAGRPPGASTPAPSTAPASSAPPTGPPPSSPGSPARTAPATSTTTSSWCRTRSAASPTRSSPRSPSTSTATTATSPRRSSPGLAEMGAFGLSIPEEYGGYGSRRRVRAHRHGRGHRGAVPRLARRRRLADHPPRDPHPGARSRAAPRSRSTHWLPKLATAEVMNAVAVTEPDFGSDVAGIKVTATKVDGGYLINGVKTWCTFGARGDVLMLLARTDPDRTQDPPRPVDVHRAQAPRRRPRLRVRPGGAATVRPAAGRWRAARSTRSATAACTPTRSRSTPGSWPTPTSSAGRAASARASTCRWPASRTAGCRPRPAPSA